MSQSMADQHLAEVEKGERFQFGKNWTRFLNTLTDQKISQAEKSLQAALSAAHLDGKTFLDVGSGSGLFSLAARRLGAKVHSFDYDPNSVACTKELKRRFNAADDRWTIEQGSVLDRAYLASLGTFDVVYSWGVLHHTGQMWTALDNVKTLVKLNGQLYISIYNDLGAVTDRWRTIKRTYNRLPFLLHWLLALSIIAASEARTMIYDLRSRSLRDYFRRWTHYDSIRGMNKWFDWIDWIGGYPYECATLEDLIDFYSKDGFSLEYLVSRASETGCNETVFRRKADFGIYLYNPLPQSRFLVRRHGRRISGPFRTTSSGHIARIPDVLSGMPAGSLLLFQDGKLVGPACPSSEPETIIVAPPDWPEFKVAATKFDVVPGKLRKLEPPFQHYRGHMFAASLTELKHLADDVAPHHDSSPVYVFEDKQQLAFPHAPHADIVKFGEGRFSHWSQEILFSSLDKSDPRHNCRTYEIIIAEVG